MSNTVRWSVHIVTDDPSASLPDAIRALEVSEPPPEAVIVVDNAPAGRPRPEVLWPNVRWLRNPRPQSHGRCHNQAIEFALHAARDNAAETIVLVLTPDVMLGPDTLSVLQNRFATDSGLACLGPIICRAHVTGFLESDRRELEATDIVDSAGIALGLLARPKVLGRGNKRDALSGLPEPFAPSPSCFAVRLSALSAMSRQGPWFRESGNDDEVAIALFRGLKAAGFSLAVEKGACAWRLAARGDLR